MKHISRKSSMLDLVTAYPEIGDIMVSLGFEDIVKPGMLQSMGRFMTLEKGAKLKNVNWSSIEATFNDYGFEID